MDLATRRGFLGFSFQGREHLEVRLDPQSLRHVNAVIRQHTKRARSMAMAERIRRLNEYLVGWVGYFALADTPSVFEDLDKWLRRRLRACRWKEWKRGRTRSRMFRKVGLPERDARQGFSKKGVWRMAGAGAMQQALSRSYWADQGLCTSSNATLRSTSHDEPPDAGPHVRWCERRGRRPLLYSILRD